MGILKKIKKEILDKRKKKKELKERLLPVVEVEEIKYSIIKINNKSTKGIKILSEENMIKKEE